MESFEVENFRSLKHLKLEKMARVNLLVGKNNSGKTSVLEAMLVLSGINSTGWYEILTRNRDMPSSEAEFRQLFFNSDFDTKIALSATYNNILVPSEGATTLKATLSLTFPTTQKTINESEWDNYNSLAMSSHEDILNISLEANNKGEAVQYALVPLRNSNTKRLSLKEVSVNALQLLEGILKENAFRVFSTFVSTRPRLRNLSSTIERLKVRKLDDELVAVLRKVDSRIERIELGGAGQIYFNLGPRFPTLFPVNLMGEGIQRLLAIITAMINRANGIVFIDEIDNGLHYSALRILWQGILYAAHKYDVQIVVTTHSIEALRHLTWVLDDEENARYRDDVAAYTLIRADDDKVRSYRYGAEQLEYAMEHDIEVRN